MADDITIPVQGIGSGPKPVATDDVGGRHFQRVKVTLGADGVNDGDVATGNPMPVAGPLTDAELRASDVPVDGSGVVQPISAAALPLPAGAATEATLSMLTTPTDTQPVSVAALPLPAGAATEATLGTLNGKVVACDTNNVHANLDDVLVALKAIFNAIAKPMSMDAATSRLRAAIESSVSLSVGTVTAVTTVTGITNLGGIAITGDLSHSTHLAAWGSVIRARVA